jgi:hypothetical protein
MKRILSFSLMLTAMVVSMTGCLKDKGFDNQEYGINDPDSQPPGVGFPLGGPGKYTVGLNVSGSVQKVDDVVYINLESGSPAPTDIVITLTNNTTAMLAAYNTANGTSILPLSNSLFTVPLTITIPAGQRNAQVPINVSSTLALDPNKSYGIGLQIASVTGNYVIASNLKNLLLEFTIKNKYDGKYNLRGYHNRAGLDAPYNAVVHMITTGPNSVTMYWPALGNYAHPINAATTYYGSFTTNFIFDPATNNLIAWDQTPYPASLVPTVAPDPAPNQSRWVPGPPAKIYAHFWYNNNPTQRGFYDTLTYVGPR